MICFDEWGLWHKEATSDNGTRQIQTLRDGIFAACAMHLFYRNSDIVEFAMQTQLANLLSSLFETDGACFYMTPTYYVFKLFKEHKGQYVITTKLTEESDEMIDYISSINEGRNKLTVSVINKDYTCSKDITIHLDDAWTIEKADILTAEDIHNYNSYTKPGIIKDISFEKNVNNI
jgi:alpha-N-arabinofuranosidase